MVDIKSLKQRFYDLVDVQMFPAKLTFFFTDGFFGSTMPFMNVFYTSVGLSPTYAGFITGISFIVSSIFNPLWSTLADATGYRKLVFTIMCLGTGTSVFSLPWVELAVSIRTTNNNTSFNSSNVKNANSTCSHASGCLLNPQTLFYAMLALNIVGWVFYTSLRCFVDGTITNVANATKKMYGPQRAFASLGFACFNLIAGVIADYYDPPHGMSPYTGVFYVFLTCVVCLVPFGYVLINQGVWERADRIEGESGKVLLKDLLSLFKKSDMIVFIASVFMIGLIMNILNCFLFVLMEQEMHSSKTIMSLTVVNGIISEVTMFFSAPKVIPYLHGNIVSLIIGIFSYFPRYILMSYLVNPWYMLALQPLQALGMGLAWNAIVNHVYEVVPQHLQFTAVAMMSSIHVVATMGISSMVGGVLYDKYGGRLLFRYTGIMAAVWSVIMVVYYGGMHYFKNKEELSSDDVDLEDGEDAPML